jgi:GT2 family glycosyltransferase/ubiquinone/menaquinone biosynthesis C-methylase UbiE
MSGELERFDPAEQDGRIVYEHLHRYALCKEFATGRRVLDLACGTGYGTAILGTAAAQVTGLDISAKAIRAARKRYATDNVNFVIGDCFDLPFEAGSFDLVVANEMIEHVEGHSALLAEIRRVLADKGLLLVSTPNKPVYNRYKPPNAYHVAELEIPEFRKLLTDRFQHVRLTGTRMALLSVGYAIDSHDERISGNLNAARIHLAASSSAGEPRVETGELQLEDPEYVLAMCSDAPLEDVALSSSIFFDERNDLWLEHEKIMAWASGLHDGDEVLREDLARTRDLLEQARSHAGQVEAECADMADRLEQLRSSQGNLSGALEGERQALARETEAVRREASARSATLAELLGRMISQTVEPDDASIVSSLFQINEALVREQLQRAHADQRNHELGALVSALQGEAAQLTSERARLALELSARGDELEAERRQRAEIEAAREALAGEVRAAEDRLSELRAEAAEASASLSAELSARNHELETERRLRAELEAAPVIALTEVNAPPAAPAGDDRAGFALAQLHRRAAAALELAPAQVAGQIAPRPEPVPLRWHRRVLGKERAFETSIFSNPWLARQDPRLTDLSLRDFIADPENRALSPHPLFDARYYLLTYPDVAESGMSPLVHYVLHGWREGRDPHPLFANDWYLAQNPDVAAHGAISALDHYLLHGWREGRRPNPLFDPRPYLDRYPDVEAADFEPLTHFILYGEDEGRELTIDGWSQVLQDVATQGGPLHVMQRLLREPPGDLPQPPSSGHDEVPMPAPWPPTPVDDFWPTQTMREMIAEAHGEPLLSRISYLLSLMNRWQDRQAEFASSEDCRQLLARLRVRANAVIPAEDHVPSATVIIPVYNNVLDTLLCLASLLELDERQDFEVIVADDGSSDATAALVTTVGGMVRYVRQPRNLGFLGNCNGAAAQARGKTIVLLNNDTLVFTGWLDGLLEPFQQFSDVGLVGSKLINWDGTLQEAGGIFWRDGSAWNFGRNQDSRAPEFNYLKDVDYCSGASIAIPASIWRELGGFDTMYSPAYCEDSDMAFRLREAGYRTLYSPASMVVHHEGRSHGRDVASGVKAYQAINITRFVQRWHEVLERDHFPNAHEVLLARDRSFAKQHVLVIDHYVPQWDKDAGSRTLYQYIKILVDGGCQVSFWPDNLGRDPIYTPLLQALGVEVLYGQRHVGKFAEFMEERGATLDMVLVARPHVAINYVGEVRRRSKARIVYYGVDVHFKRMEASFGLGVSADPEEIATMRKLELSVCRDSDVILYPDPAEVALIRELVGGEREFIANPIFAYGAPEIDASRSRLPGVAGKRGGQLVFVGGFNHPPNCDGIIWFVSEVLPIIRESFPHAVLDIIGSNAPRDVVALASNSVRVRGFISDPELEQAYRGADLVVAPLRFGAGVKGKVIEAMSQTVPVATTSFGAQGISEPHEKLFLGDDATGFAQAVIAALQNRGEAMRRAGNALNFVQAKYSEEAVRDLLLRLARPAASKGAAS